MADRTYKSEADRQQAMAKLPEFPERGETVDAFNARVDAEKAAIQEATIGNEPAPAPAIQEPQVPQAPAVEGVAPSAPAPAPEPQDGPKDDDVMFFLSDGKTPVLRRDLDEDLKRYKNGQEVLKSAAHARKYANTAEKRLQEQADEIARLRASPSLTADGGYGRQAPAPASAPQPTPVAQPVIEPAVAKELESVDDIVHRLESFDLDDPTLDDKTKASLQKTMRDVAGVTASLKQAVLLTKAESAAVRAEADKNLRELRSKVEESEREATESKRKRATDESNKTVEGHIRTMQDRYPELKTSKVVFGTGDEKQTVEKDVVAFANKILLAQTGRTATNWAEVNRVINSYNRQDAQTLAFCNEHGIKPEDVGSSAKDILNYATIVNAVQIARGKKINEYTGKEEPFNSSMGTDERGNPLRVVFPDPLAAYEYALRTSGLSDRIIEQRMAQAAASEANGLLSAVGRQATRVKGIGSEGAASPDASATLSKEAATDILRKVDLADVEQRALRGDRTLFNVYTKAQKALGLPESQPLEHWPKEKVAQLAR
jgi:hypothetical protein